MLCHMSNAQPIQRQIFVVRVWSAPQTAVSHSRGPWRAQIQDVQTGQITLLETPGQLLDFFLHLAHPPHSGLK